MALLVQMVLIAGLAPLLQGAMRRLRARLQGRPGASVLQPYRDLIKLWRKEALLPEGVSIVALCAPGIALGVALAFAAVLPLIRGPLGSVDVIALAFLLALGRFVVTLAALDMRSAFTGMAASREMTFASLAEPTLLIVLVGAAALGKDVTLGGMRPHSFGAADALAVAALFLILLLETARVPIDNQETHYELTMIHEGLSLEYSGWHLALMQFAAYVRQLDFLLLAALFLPGSGLFAIAGWVAALAVAITAVETAFAKVRLFEVPQLLTTAFILAVTSIGLRIAGIMP